MDTKQLYAGGKPFEPLTNFEKHETPEKIQEMDTLLNLLADKVANQLLQKTDIAAWAKQPQKPAYNAAEVGADASGSASGALAAAKEYADSTYMQATGYTDTAIAGLINGAPTTLDTLGEIAAAMLEHENVVDALNAAIGSKASEVEYQAHARNGTIHVTASDKEALAEAVSGVKELKEYFQEELNSNLGFALLPNFGNQHSGCIVCNPAAKTVSITLGLYSDTSFATKTLIYNIGTQYAPKSKKIIYGIAQKDHQLFAAQLEINTDGSITYYGDFGDGSCDLMIFTGSYYYG